MTFFSAVSKLIKRKKKSGYYEASQILTVEEKQNLVIVLISLFIPLIISSFLIFINSL